MKNKTTIILGLAIVLALVGYLFYKKFTTSLNQEFQLSQPSQLSKEIQSLSQTTPAPTESSTESSSTAQPQNQNVVIFTDSGYSPNTLRIKVGETVTFKNRSSQAMWPASAFHPTHTVYSGSSLTEHCPDTTRTAFDACTGIQPGSSWSFTFNKKGSWQYHDHLNPVYIGTIIVE